MSLQRQIRGSSYMSRMKPRWKVETSKYEGIPIQLSAKTLGNRVERRELQANLVVVAQYFGKPTKFMYGNRKGLARAEDPNSLQLPLKNPAD